MMPGRFKLEWLALFAALTFRIFAAGLPTDNKLTTQQFFIDSFFDVFFEIDTETGSEKPAYCLPHVNPGDPGPATERVEWPCPGKLFALPDRMESEALQMLHPEGLNYVQPELLVLPKLELEDGEVLDESPGLVMYWDAPDPPDDALAADVVDVPLPATAAWEYVLKEDPDFSNMCLTLTVMPRTYMTSISFSLRDVNGNMKGWRWPVPAVFPPNVKTTFSISAGLDFGQYGSSHFWKSPSFDITQVMSFEFDESGFNAGTLPLPPGVPNGPYAWNYWSNIMVFPCPPVPIHYDCWKVLKHADEDKDFKAKLIDQFIPNGVDVKLNYPTEICAPADKNDEGIPNDDIHLACYYVKPNPTPQAHKLVGVENQAGDDILEVLKLKKLCIPSKKYHVCDPDVVGECAALAPAPADTGIGS